MSGVKSLRSRLNDGDFVICAEGYLFEFERRGYLQAGAYVPEVVLENPHLVKILHEEFVHAGSDVVEVFTYYAHREKLRHISREHELEAMNRTALRIARQVANETGTLMAGNICNSCVYDQNDRSKDVQVRDIFKEQIQWAVEEGADYVIAETIADYKEAKIALDCIKQYAPGKEAVITMSQVNVRQHKTADNYTYAEAIERLHMEGADVAGLNCKCSPLIHKALLTEIRKTCTGHLASLPVPYSTTWEQPHMTGLVVQKTQQRAFPYNLDSFLCDVDDIVDFTHYCKENGVQYIGLCCGNSARFTRAMAETLGRKPTASKYSPIVNLEVAPHDDEIKIHNLVTDSSLKEEYVWTNGA